MDYQPQPPTKFPVPPPVHPSQLPQFVAPSRASKALQIGAFSLCTGIAFYSVLIYDFGPQEHCFMPIRRWFDSHTAGFFTLSEQDRKALSPASALKPAPASALKPVDFGRTSEEKKV
ncbi:pyridoxamine-phosphate oxidase [Pseudohyphozyma bogoriensis]|nr:pyridoxamine-phosphate oxidase [Pseudohyphozyma bogoriensis]